MKLKPTPASCKLHWALKERTHATEIALIRWIPTDAGVCNLVEVALQITAARLLLRRKPEATAQGVLLAFTTQGFTLWKTVLYWWALAILSRCTQHRARLSFQSL